MSTPVEVVEGTLAPANEARVQLRAYALALHIRAADAHSEGMALERTSARVDQLASTSTDDQAIMLRDAFTKAKCLVTLPAITGPGGTA